MASKKGTKMGRVEQFGDVTPYLVEQFGDATLYLGDCLKIMPELGPVDAVVTDPPWGANYRSGHNSGRKGTKASMIRKDGNFTPITGDDKPFDPAPWCGYPEVILWGAPFFCDKLAPGNAWRVWDKLAGKTPVPSGSDVELAWTNIRGPSRLFTHLWRGIMRAGAENVVHGGKLHPNQKPVALLEWCIKPLAARIILDPYMGSGTTGVACMNLGRKFIGIEIEEKYFDIACRRINLAASQTRMNLGEI